MILIGKDEILKFSKKHAQSKKTLVAWSYLISKNDFKDLNELHKTFPSADYVHHKYTVFNIAGNKYRLIAMIDYDAQVISIQQIWTHAEYSRSKNQDALKRGSL